MFHAKDWPIGLSCISKGDATRFLTCLDYSIKCNHSSLVQKKNSIAFVISLQTSIESFWMKTSACKLDGNDTTTLDVVSQYSVGGRAWLHGASVVGREVVAVLLQSNSISLLWVLWKFLLNLPPITLSADNAIIFKMLYTIPKSNCKNSVIWFFMIFQFRILHTYTSHQFLCALVLCMPSSAQRKGWTKMKNIARSTPI